MIKDYCAEIDATVALSPIVGGILEYRSRITEAGGYVRMKLALINGDTLELFEYFSVDEEVRSIITEKYSYHWQRQNGELRKRWDNAPHHQEIGSYPHHVHDGNEKAVKPGQARRMSEIITVLNEELTGRL